MINLMVHSLLCSIGRKECVLKKVTIQDVAAELHLSRNTVAKALNNSETVAYETRMLVIRKACEMGYQKVPPVAMQQVDAANASNDNARKRAEKGTIMVIARREISAFLNSIIMGISDAVNQSNCEFRLCFVSNEEEMRLEIPTEIDEKVSGLLVISVFSDKFMQKVLSYGLPVVCLDCPLRTENIEKKVDIVVCEGASSTKKITRRLIDNGIRKFGFIGDTTYCLSIKERYDGFAEALKEHGIPEYKKFEATVHTRSRYYAYDEVADYLNSLDEYPEAFVCSSDDIAFFVIKFLKAKGVLVPKDIAVTGYDNIESLTTDSEPWLTTVNVSNQLLGRRIVKQLLWRLENPEFPHEKIMIDSDVVFRKSSEKITLRESVG